MQALFLSLHCDGRDVDLRGCGEYVDTREYFYHGLINYIDTKATCRHPKNLPVKGPYVRCLSV
jgi:hypothetical protein